MELRKYVKPRTSTRSLKASISPFKSQKYHFSVMRIQRKVSRRGFPYPMACQSWFAWYQTKSTRPWSAKGTILESLMCGSSTQAGNRFRRFKNDRLWSLSILPLSQQITYRRASASRTTSPRTKQGALFPRISILQSQPKKKKNRRSRSKKVEFRI